MSITPVDDAVYTALGNFLNTIMDGAAEVVRQLDNRVPMPDGPFVTMGPSSMQRLSWPMGSYDRDAGLRKFEQHTRYTIQLDFYGPQSHDQAWSVATLFFTEYGVQQFKPGGVSPLYCDDPHQMPLIDGEQQFEQRWSFNVHVQYNPVISVPQEFADELEIGLIEVDSTYPA